MKIAAWNMNSVRRRLDLLKRFVNDSGPDVIRLQETKVPGGLFPIPLTLISYDPLTLTLSP